MAVCIIVRMCHRVKRVDLLEGSLDEEHEGIVSGGRMRVRHLALSSCSWP